jgi:hypothetical protein
MERLSAWRNLVYQGAYKGARWSFGRKTAFKDLTYLLLPRKLIAALPTVYHEKSGDHRDTGSVAE